MKPILGWLSLGALACGEAKPPTALPSPTSCEEADYSRCGGPLPPTAPDGQPWPTFSEALAAEMTCADGRGGNDVWLEHLRGECADGKQFIAKNGGFIGTTQYFEGERLVGLVRYTDIAGTLCTCPTSSFSGTLDSVRCDAPVFESLCDTTAPQVLEPEFSQGTAYCTCDDP